MMKRRKRSWIGDALSALACAVDGLELLLEVVDKHAVVDSGDVSFGAGLRG